VLQFLDILILFHGRSSKANESKLRINYNDPEGVIQDVIRKLKKLEKNMLRSWMRSLQTDKKIAAKL